MMEKLIGHLAPYFRPGRDRRRAVMAVLGVLICGVGVALCRMAGFGVDPFQTLCTGLYRVIPLDEGLTYILINVVLLIAVLLMNPHYVGLGTLINLFLLGYVADYSQQGLQALFGTPALWGQIAYLAAGIIVICVSCAMYISADLGVSTYDAISLHLADKKLAPYRFLRIGTDLICVLIGWLLGAPVGICTLVTAFLLGPLVSFLRTRLFQPMIDGRTGQEGFQPS